MNFYSAFFLVISTVCVACAIGWGIIDVKQLVGKKYIPDTLPYAGLLILAVAYLVLSAMLVAVGYEAILSLYKLFSLLVN